MTQELKLIKNMPVIIKTLGQKEPYERIKLETAIKKAVGFNNTELVNDIISYVEDRLNEDSVTTGYINTLVEAYLFQKAEKEPNFYKYFHRYVENKHRKHDELRKKIVHLSKKIKSSKDISKLKKFTSNQAQIAATRYLLKDIESGEVIEDIEEWFERVANCVVLGSVMHDPEIFDINPVVYNIFGSSNINHKYKYLKDYQIEIIKHVYGRNIKNMKHSFDKTIEIIDEKLYNSEKYTDLRERYKGLMYEGIFEPNTPTLMNAGSGSGGLSACFTLDVEDNMKSIVNTQASAHFIFKMAGGLGVNISKIRPKGSPVADTPNAASGGIGLVLEMIDKATEEVKQGGKRRGANMGIMNYNHPQILEFISYKLQEAPQEIKEIIEILKYTNPTNPNLQKYIDSITPKGKLLNFNISVMFDAKFWEAYFNNLPFNLEYGGKIYDVIQSRDLIDKIAENAWKSAEPGVLFMDNMNKKNPLRPIYGDIHITNPCSEQAMYDGESCTLGSINLSKFVDEDREFNFEDFKKITRLCTRFLNDVLEVNKFPTEYIEEQSRKTNRIGLGIMGFADMLFKMRIRFNSEQAYNLTRMLGSLLYWESVTESKELALERGACQAFQDLIKSGSKPEEIVNRIYNTNVFESNNDVMQHLDKGVRNAWTTTIAPTGTISMIANCSNGLEPIFALVFKKTVSTGDYYYLNEEFRRALMLEGLDNDEIIKSVEANNGSCQGIEGIPKWIQETFVTAMDLHWTDHIVSQAIWQEYIDNSISKTINLPFNATQNDIRYAYVLAHEIGLKGVSVYRDGSRDKQVLHTNTSIKSNNGEIGARAEVSKIVKKSEPSEATLNYIRETIQNEQVKNEFQVIAFKSQQDQEFIKERQDCPFCKKGILVNMSGCLSCNICGQSTKCSIG